MGETSLLEAEGLGRGIAYYISRNGLRELVATNHGKGVLAQVNQENRALRPRSEVSNWQWLRGLFGAKP